MRGVIFLLALSLCFLPPAGAGECKPCRPSCFDDFICCCGECVSKFQGCKPKSRCQG